MTSEERVRTLIEGRKPDRVVVYDLLRNDAVIEYYSGEKLTLGPNDFKVVCKAVDNALDATRSVRLPQAEREEVIEDGRRLVIKRWTTWIEERKVILEEYVKELEQKMAVWDWTENDEKYLKNILQGYKNIKANVGDTFLFMPYFSGPNLDEFYGEIGLEQLSYLLYNYPQIISKFMEYKTVKSIQYIEHLPSLMFDGIMVYFDMAYKDRLLFSPSFLRREYFLRLEKIISAYHKKGYKVMFHSDGNLMEVLEDLVNAGVDILNPIERLAGMEPKEIHRRYKNLILAGGIDVSQLLPFGKPEEIKSEVYRVIEDTEGKVMIGSSTELHNLVPLENFIAMVEAAKSYKL